MKAIEKTPRLDDSQKYRDGSAKLATYQLTKADREAARQRIIAERNDRYKSLAADDLMKKADAVVLGTSLHAPELRVLDRNLETLNEEIALLDQAIARQLKTIDEIAIEISVDVLEKARPAHTAIVREMAETMARLAILNAKEQQFRSELDAAGFVSVDGYLRPMYFNRVGLIADEQSFANQFFNECVELDFITDKEAQSLRKGGRL
jgi:hypothetical protein